MQIEEVKETKSIKLKINNINYPFLKTKDCIFFISMINY